MVVQSSEISCMELASVESITLGCALSSRKDTTSKQLWKKADYPAEK